MPFNIQFFNPPNISGNIDLDRFLVETATKIVITHNEFNDKIWGAQSTTDCLYRDISALDEVQNREEVRIDGLLWFKATEDVARGDIYYHPDEGYLEIVSIVKAKRLLVDQTRKFIKCTVQRIRQVS